MPYAQYTTDQVASQIATLLDDTGEVYWSRQEKYYAIWEALRVWGALTGYWRARGTFAHTSATTWYDLSVLLPNLRSRSWTLGDMVREIQYMTLENPSGVAGTGMSGQISISSILSAIQRGRNRFVQDARFPLTAVSLAAVPSPPEGMIEFDESFIYVHRAAWRDLWSGTVTNLWREDAWGLDAANPYWTVEPRMPTTYSESESSPLKLQLSPAPARNGSLEVLAVKSLALDLTSDATTFDVPDEWVHAIKYAALEDLFSAESQNKDPLRAQYAANRYATAVMAARDIKTVLRVLVDELPLPLDTLVSIDASYPNWMFMPGAPFCAGALYDMIALAPALPQRTYGVAVDVAQCAVAPTPGAYVQIGQEDLPHIIDYATHLLAFKCGGQEFQSSLPQYDSFMKAVVARGQINEAKIRYMMPLFGQPQKEQVARPDRMEANA